MLPRSIISVVLAGILPVITALSTDLTANRDLTGGAVLTATPDSVTAQADGKTYRWADKNGDGTADDPVDANLNLAGFSLTRTTDTTGFSLNLNNGTSDGAIAWGGLSGGSISTRRTDGTDQNGGPITITGATDIVCSNINSSGNGTGIGGQIVMAQSGNMTIAYINARGTIGGSRAAGSISVTGAGGSSETPVGWLQIADSISTYGSVANGIAIKGYEKVTVGINGIKAYQTASSSLLSGVTLTNIGPGGVEVTGVIQTYAEREYGTSTVIVCTAGDMKLDSVDTHSGNGGNWVYHDGGDVRLTAGGNVEITGAVMTYMLGGGGVNSRNAGNVEIVSSNGWVNLNSVIATNKANDTARYAGDASVTAGGNIAIAGDINLYAPFGGDRRGDLTLTTGAGGNVTLASLNIGNVNIVRIDSGTGLSEVTGGLTNFNTASSGGSGTVGDPFVATQTQLRVPAGERLYYSHVAGGLNDYLGGHVYQLRNLDNSSAGGLLMVRPNTPQGTVFRFQ